MLEGMSRDDFFDALTTSVGLILRSQFERADLCVLGTRIGYDTCRYFGVDATPVTVRLLAFNQRWATHMEAVQDIDDPSWEQAVEDGAWSVVINENDSGDPDRYAGHLVLACPHPDGDRLVDLSTRQFSRPEHAMVFPDAAAYRIDLAEFEQGEPFMVTVDDPSAFILYRYRADKPDYRKGPDWRAKQPFSGAAIRMVRDVVGRVEIG